MKQTSMLDVTEGRRRRDAGVEATESANGEWIQRIRAVAVALRRQLGTTTVDDLRVYADNHNLQPQSPNAWGAVFRGEHWEVRGYAQSAYKSNHARRVIVWGLKS